MDNLLNYTDFTLTETILLALFAFFTLLEIFYFLYYYKSVLRRIRRSKSVNADDRENSTKPSVSVLIVASNAGSHLEKTLPIILEQDYPNFEVIVVNNGSTDETETLLISLHHRYKNLYGTYVPHSRDNTFGRKKLALTIGIKAAKNDIILITEPYCQPVSKNWISLMVNELTPDKDVVAGYASFYPKPRTFAGHAISYDNLLYSLHYLSMIIKRKPFSATFRNLIIRKSLFFEHKGFASVLNFENGEELFLNQVMTKENTTLCVHPDSFAETILQEDEKYVWKTQKIGYQKIKGFFRKKSYMLYNTETCIRFILLALWAAITVNGVLTNEYTTPAISTVLALVLIIFYITLINQSAKKLHSSNFIFSLPFLTLFQPILNIYCKYQMDKSRKIIGNY